MSTAPRLHRIRLYVIAVVLGALFLAAMAAFLIGARTASQHPAAPGVTVSWAPPSAPSSHPSTVATTAVPAPPRATATTSPARDAGEDPAEPTATVPASDDAIEAAANFAANWLNAWPATGEQWLAIITPLMTPDCAAQFTPDSAKSVPTGRVGGPVKGVLTSPTFAEVDVPVIASNGRALGTLGLQLLRSGRTWLVNSVDWTRA